MGDPSPFGKPTLGNFKIALDRLHGYFGKLQFFMVGWLFFQTVPWSWWVLVGILIGVPLILWIDLRYVLPSEYRSLCLANPEWMKLQASVEKRNNEEKEPEWCKACLSLDPGPVCKVCGKERKK